MEKAAAKVGRRRAAAAVRRESMHDCMDDGRRPRPPLGSQTPLSPPALPQRGDSAAAVDAKRRELEAKRAQQAARADKTFYKVTVRVRLGRSGKREGGSGRTE